MKRLIFLFTTILIYTQASSQLTVGASFGTFNYPGARDQFKGLAPTIKLEYFHTDYSSLYIEGALYNKEFQDEPTAITTKDGDLIGMAETKLAYSIKNFQVGFKSILGRKEISEKGFSFFLGAGADFSFVTRTYQYTLPGYVIDNSKTNNSIFGFHFAGGVQYRFKPVIIELKQNVNLMIKPVVPGWSYWLLSAQLGVLVPITR